MNIFSYDIIKNYYDQFTNTIGAIIKNEKCDSDNIVIQHDIYVNEVNSTYCIAREKFVGRAWFTDGKLTKLKLYACDCIAIDNEYIDFVEVDDSYCIIYDSDEYMFYCITGEYKQKILDLYVAFKAFNTNMGEV